MYQYVYEFIEIVNSSHQVWRVKVHDDYTRRVGLCDEDRFFCVNGVVNALDCFESRLGESVAECTGERIDQLSVPAVVNKWLARLELCDTIMYVNASGEK
jgi:hypothetical protein